MQTLIKSLWELIGLWHSNGETTDMSYDRGFCLPEKPNRSIEKEIIRWAVHNAFHNYMVWHLIEQYDNPDPSKALFFFNGGKDHNTKRNISINMMDELFLAPYGSTPSYQDINSESLGSIIDRMNIANIKYLHYRDMVHQNTDIIEAEYRHLKKSATKLAADMQSGKRTFKTFTKQKIMYNS